MTTAPRPRSASNRSGRDKVRPLCGEREFEHQRFTVWRCPGCGCIHALEEVDLARYYPTTASTG